MQTAIAASKDSINITLKSKNKFLLESGSGFYLETARLPYGKAFNYFPQKLP